MRCADQVIAFFKRDGFNALAADVFKRRQLDFFHHALCGGEEDVLVFRELADGQDGADFFAFFQLDNVVDRTTAAVAAAFRQFVHFNPMALAQIGKAHQIIMRIGNKQGFDEVFVFGCCCLFAAAAATLRLIVGGRLGFDVAAMSQGNDHFTLRNQVFISDIAAKRIDFAATLIAEVGFDVCQFFADDLGNALWFGKNIHEINDFAHQVFIFADNFFLIEAGQVAQAHAQNGIGLQFAQVIALAVQTQILWQAFRAHHVQV